MARLIDILLILGGLVLIVGMIRDGVPTTLALAVGAAGFAALLGWAGRTGRARQ